MKADMRKLGDWFDERTGYRALVAHALDEEIPGGARWAYVFGSGLLTLFIVQVVTGLMLMATYTPAVTGAWASVYYVQHQVAGGWFVRGLHSYAGHKIHSAQRLKPAQRHIAQIANRRRH